MLNIVVYEYVMFDDVFVVVDYFVVANAFEFF